MPYQTAARLAPSAPKPEREALTSAVERAINLATLELDSAVVALSRQRLRPEFAWRAGWDAIRAGFALVRWALLRRLRAWWG